MATAYFAHGDCDAHVNPPGHPEQVARLQAVAFGLEGIALDRRAAPLAVAEDVYRCHPARYLDRVRQAIPVEGWAQLDGDTYLVAGIPGRGLARCRGVLCRRGWGACGPGAKRICRVQATGASRGNRNRDGVLSVRQCGDCCQTGVGPSWSKPRRCGRFRCASRQWHAGFAVG